MIKCTDYYEECLKNIVCDDEKIEVRGVVISTRLPGLSGLQNSRNQGIFFQKSRKNQGTFFKFKEDSRKK